MHIIFWLFKDVSWCMIWKPIGIAMIFPTLIIAIIIAWRTRELAAELAHNMAIIFWITANAYWMVSEFLGFDTVPILFGIEGKYLTTIPFAIGIIFLAYYYIFQKPREREEVFAAT
jgi:hypothetical protein